MVSSDFKVKDILFKKAEAFIRQFYLEKDLEDPEVRLEEIRNEIEEQGIYSHTKSELLYGAKTAWRNSNRCIGRVFHESLEVLDFRGLIDADDIMEALVQHIQRATNGGNIRSVISVFKPRHPLTGEQIRIWNPKLIRYAGYRTEEGIVGDPEEIDFTEQCQNLGWQGDGTRFDLLPVVIELPGQKPVWYELPKNSVLEVEMEHPEYGWFKELDLKWYAVPVIGDMVLEIGGIQYTAAPFNGWFMETEIGSRNFGDAHRFNQLPLVASRMGVDTRNDRTLWKDRAMTELNQAVLHSFRKNGVRIVDHHTASRQFMAFCNKEESAGREVMADWSWIVPPSAGSAMQIFHQNWENEVKTPNFYYNTPAWIGETESRPVSKCPFHVSNTLMHQT